MSIQDPHHYVLIPSGKSSINCVFLNYVSQALPKTLVFFQLEGENATATETSLIIKHGEIRASAKIACKHSKMAFDPIKISSTSMVSLGCFIMIAHTSLRLSFFFHIGITNLYEHPTAVFIVLHKRFSSFSKPPYPFGH